MPNSMTLPTIRVYVGSAQSHQLLVDVLAWSIRRHTRRTVEVRAIGELLPNGVPMPRKPENRPATPFSFQRFAVPELAGFSGRAIYVDSDQLVLRDIAELFDRPMRGMRLQRRTRWGPDGRARERASSVMLLDCARLDWRPQRIADELDRGRYSYTDLMRLRTLWLKGSFPRHWNSFDHHEPGRTGLLHYTKRRTQPWLARNHPHGAVWFEALYAGLDAGEIKMDSVATAHARGYVRPSLLWQVEHRLLQSADVPASFHPADDAFYEHCRVNQFNNLDGDYRSRA